MPKLTSVTATYGRTIQPAQYQSEKAELSATIVDENGVGERDVSDLVTTLAVHCYNALGQPVPERFVLPVAPKAETAATQAETVTRAGRKPRAPKENPVPVALADSFPAKVVDFADPIFGASPTLTPPAVAETITEKPAEMRDPILGASPTLTPPSTAPAPTPQKLEISDKDISSECAKAAARLGKVDIVWKLLAEYGIKPGGKMGDIPQDKRAEFVAKAQALGKATK